MPAGEKKRRATVSLSPQAYEWLEKNVGVGCAFKDRSHAIEQLVAWLAAKPPAVALDIRGPNGVLVPSIPVGDGAWPEFSVDSVPEGKLRATVLIDWFDHPVARALQLVPRAVQASDAIDWPCPECDHTVRQVRAADGRFTSKGHGRCSLAGRQHVDIRTL